MSLAIPLDYDEIENTKVKADKMRSHIKSSNKYSGAAGLEFQWIPEDIKADNNSGYNPILFEEEYVNNNQKKTSETDEEEGKVSFEPFEKEAKCGPFGMYCRPSIAPVLKAKDKTKSSELDKEYKGYHLFVLVHGYLGAAEDLRYFKNAISILCPKPIFLLSKANESNINEDIYIMGKNLAEEVISKIRDWCPGDYLGRLSFIGHSLGGLIIRAALPHLAAYGPKMHWYLGLVCPQIGNMYSKSSLVKAGMWILNKWKGSTALSQIKLSDSKNLTKTALFKLSKEIGFEWFKHIGLMSSFQDTYTTPESSRVQISTHIIKDKKFGSSYIEMVSNILSQITSPSILRINVDFEIKDGSLDSYIGRTAHVQFIENQKLIDIIVNRYPQFFK